MYSMILCVTADTSVKNIKSLPDCDLAIFGFSGLGEVSYESELKGESEKFEEAARLSKRSDCGILCGCITYSRGIKRKSVAAADRGKLLGISDMIHVLDGDDFKSGAGLGVYDIGGYKIGVLVENDLFFPDCIRALSACGSNAICVFLEELKTVMPPLLIRTYAFLYGVPIIMCAGNISYFADITGEMATVFQPYAMYDVNIQSGYRLMTSRIKGLYSESNIDF